MKTALVYDRVNKWGGAERVLLALHKIFPDAPLYTSVYHKEKAPWAKVFKVKTSFLQKFPWASSYHELYAPLMPLAFESFSFDEYDLVISVTSEAAKGIVTKPGTLHICYCLTPTRYLWSGYEDYFKNPILRFLSKPVVYYLKLWDRIAAQRPDKIIAISKEVQKRIKKYYNRDSEIIYPPLMLSVEVVHKNFRVHNAGNSSLPQRRDDANVHSENFVISSRSDGKYFLIVSRLVPYKRIDIAVNAFNRLGLPLKIIGRGSEKERLEKMANDNIEFLDYLTDKELVEYYKECLALIFPGKEDFGLTILEAQSFGKPVIAFGDGGSIETIIDNKTGLFFGPQKESALIKTIDEFMKKKFNPQDSISNAQKFSFENFKKQFKKLFAISYSLLL
ncbi:MAG: glycosyltransferase [Candidatus Levybacteria bacterium]|nr:glycosyltransferase [Candidatus Levybacteria bacterium]